jgi:hypothetical protein
MRVTALVAVLTTATHDDHFPDHRDAQLARSRANPPRRAAHEQNPAQPSRLTWPAGLADGRLDTRPGSPERQTTPFCTASRPHPATATLAQMGSARVLPDPCLSLGATLPIRIAWNRPSIRRWLDWFAWGRGSLAPDPGRATANGGGGASCWNWRTICGRSGSSPRGRRCILQPVAQTARLREGRLGA